MLSAKFQNVMVNQQVSRFGLDVHLEYLNDQEVQTEIGVCFREHTVAHWALITSNISNEYWRIILVMENKYLLTT